MPRKTTFENLIVQLRAECRQSTNNSRGLETREFLEQILRRTQQELYDQYPWPFKWLRKEEGFKTLASGQRYYDLPPGLDAEQITAVDYQQYNFVQWLPLPQGIGPREYAMFNPEQDIRSDPQLRWDLYGDDALQFEVWPMPAQDGARVWFQGQKRLSALNSPDDRADLDDVLIVLFAASEILAARKAPEADYKLQRAQARLDALTSKFPTRRQIVFGGGDKTHPKFKDRILTAYVRR